MPAILLPSRFRQQPQYAAQLISGTLRNGLAFAFNAGGGLVDSVSGKRATTWNGLKAATVRGLGLSNNASANKTAEWDFSPVVGSEGGGYGDVTYAVLANPFAEDRASSLIGVMQTQVYPYRQLGLFANFATLGAGADYYGMLSMQSYTGGSFLYGANGAGAIDGKFHVFVGVRSAAGHFLYSDGIDVTTASSEFINNGWLDASSRISVGSEAYNTSNRVANCQIPFAAAWNRALSPAEVRALSENVWGLWKPGSRRLWVATSSDVTVALSGQALAISQGSLGVDTSVALSGQQGGLSSGTLSTAGDAIVALSGQSLSSAQGLLFPEIDVSLIGQPLASSQGGLGASLDVGLSGQALALSQGTIGTEGDVTVALAGIGMTASQGLLSPPQAQSEGGHFAGVEVIGKKRKKRDLVDRDREDIKRLIREQIEGVRQEIVRAEVPQEVKKQAKAAIQPYQSASSVDVQAMQEELSKVRQMLHMWEQQVKQQKLQRQTEEDEELLMMFL